MSDLSARIAACESAVIEARPLRARGFGERFFAAENLCNAWSNVDTSIPYVFVTTARVERLEAAARSFRANP